MSSEGGEQEVAGFLVNDYDLFFLPIKKRGLGPAAIFGNLQNLRPVGFSLGLLKQNPDDRL